MRYRARKKAEKNALEAAKAVPDTNPGSGVHKESGERTNVEDTCKGDHQSKAGACDWSKYINDVWNFLQSSPKNTLKGSKPVERIKLPPKAPSKITSSTLKTSFDSSSP